MEVRVDDEDNVPYVQMQDPTAPEISFVRAPCPSKQVMYVRCGELGESCNFLCICVLQGVCRGGF